MCIEFQCFFVLFGGVIISIQILGMKISKSIQCKEFVSRVGQIYFFVTKR